MRHCTRRNAIVLVAFTVASLLALTAERSLAQKTVTAERKADHVQPRVERGVAKEPGHLGTTVTNTQGFDPETYRVVADALKVQEIPPGRLEAFRELDRQEIRLDGWSVDLTGVDADRGTVRVKVTPLVSTTWHGASTTVLAYTEELYQIEDGQLTLIDATPVVGSPSSMIFD